VEPNNPPLEKVVPNIPPLEKVEPNNFSKKLCKTTFDKGCAKQQHFCFYLFLKGKEK
jgi:hypothetical protein